MKKLIISSLLLLTAYCEAKFATPFGAQINGAGSTMAASLMNTIITNYNKAYPCPKFIYRQSPATQFAGSANGVDRVIDNAVTFAVVNAPLTNAQIAEAPICLLQIPFALISLSIIYRLPDEFGFGSGALLAPNTNWPGHLNISPADLCTIYTGTLTWQALLGRTYNGTQTVFSPTFAVQAFARADSAEETGLFARYLACSNTSTTCRQYANSLTPNGPFCSPSVPAWGANVSCTFSGSPITSNQDMVNAVKATPRTIGYVPTHVALANGFQVPTSGQTGGVPTGIAGLFIEGSTAFTSPQTSPQGNPINYTQPTSTAVAAAVTNCNGGEFLCTTGAYPIVDQEIFVLYAAQPVNLIVCNITQFIQFALSTSQVIPGVIPVTAGCLNQSLLALDKITASICEPCIELCNPCLDQTCPLPCPTSCKG